jgi:regulator of protease activity HflC (stomatin/prohibitin superfamily)
MWKIIALVILLLIALAILIIRPKQYLRNIRTDETETKSWTWTAVVPFGLAVALVLLTSFTQVHAKEVGVGVSFGKPVAEYNAGLHVKPFWQSVTKINETVYTDEYTGNDALTVRLGDGNPATAATTIRWHVNPAAVDYIYATYGRQGDPTDALRQAVVDTQYQSVVNQVFSGFNPTSVVQSGVANDPSKTAQLSFSPDYADMANQITTQMEDAVKDADGTPLVIIDKVTVSGVGYSADTEKRIAGLVQQTAKTQQATVLEGTNAALAKANAELSNSLAGDDGVKVLVQQCLQDLADGKFTAPPGFSCWPGQGSGIVLPASR